MNIIQLYWIMSPTGAVWVDRLQSISTGQWYYRSYHRNTCVIYHGVMDDYGNLVETADFRAFGTWKYWKGDGRGNS